MELSEIENIVALMTKNGLAEFDLEREGFRIRIRRDPARSASPPAVTTAIPAAAEPAALPQAAPAAETRDILSPMVGTFYRSPSPDAAAYAEVGQQVTEESVVCIIEAMKVMNEIKAEMRGVITEVLAENGKPVDFGKPLFRLKPN